MANYTVKFKHVSSLPTNLKADNQGEIYFNSSSQIISVWGGSAWENYGGNLLNATYSDNILTITKVGGENVTLDFSDVASATGTNRVLAGLRGDVDNLQTAAGIADGATAPSWNTSNSAALKGTATLKAGIEAVDAALSAETLARENAISALDATVGSQTVAEGKHVAVEVVEADGKLTGLTVVEDDIASAEELSEEITRAKAAEEALDGRLDVIEGGDTVNGSIKKALKDAKDYADGLDSAMDVRMDAAEAAITTLKGAATVEGSVAHAVAAEAATARAAEANLQAAIDTLNGDANTAGSVKKAVADGIAGVVASAPEDFDTLKEIADWIANDTTDSAELLTRVGTLETGLTAEIARAKGEEGDLSDQIEAEAARADAAEKVNASAIAAEVTRATGKENELSAAITAEETRAKAAEKVNSDAIAVLNGADTVDGSVAKAVKTAVAAEATRINAITGTPDSGKTLQAEIDAVEASIAAEITDRGNAITTAIEALDADKSNTAANSGNDASTQIKVNVVEVDGKIDSVSVLAPAFDTAGSAAAAESSAKSYTDGEISDLKSELVGESSDAWDDNKTIYAVKNYADSIVANGLAWDWA